MGTRRTWWIGLVASLSVLSSSLPVTHAKDVTDPFQGSLEAAAKIIASLAAEEHADSVVIGSFSGPIVFGVSLGDGIRSSLRVELTKLKLLVKDSNGGIGVGGSYELSDKLDATDVAKPPGPVAGNAVLKAPLHVRLAFKLEDRLGKPLLETSKDHEVTWIPPEFLPAEEQAGPKKDAISPLADADWLPRGGVRRPVKDSKFFEPVFGAEAVCKATGGTFDFEAAVLKSGPKVTGEQVLDATQQPTAFVRNKTVLYASRSSPFGVSIFVDGQPREIELKEGLPYVKFEKGETFEVQFENHARYDASFVLELDGVNSFTFTKVRDELGAPKFKRWIVDAGGKSIIRGWHLSNRGPKNIQKFELTNQFGESAAAEVGNTARLGMIQVAIGSGWPLDRRIDPRDLKFEAEEAPEVKVAWNRRPDGSYAAELQETEPVHEYAVMAEPGAPNDADGGEPSLFIKRGKEASAKIQQAKGLRHYGPIRAMITIRYERS